MMMMMMINCSKCACNVVLYQAQSLHGPITTSARLSTSDHHLYIITDSYANE